MTSDRDATRLIDSWLQETTDVLPDNQAFFDHWLDRLPAVEQRRQSHLPWRLFGWRTSRTLTPSTAPVAHPTDPVRSSTGRPPTSGARTSPMRRAITFVAATAVVASFGGFLLAGALSTTSVDEPVPALAASPAPTASYVVTDISEPMANLRNDRRSTHVATDDALWFSVATSVYRMDAVSGEISEIPIEAEARWLLPTKDAIWAVSAFGVQQIDRADLSVPDKMARRSRGQPLMWEWQGGEPIIADGSLWIAAPGNESHALIEIDLETTSIAGEYVADADWSSDRYEPWMAAIGSYIWIHSEGRLTRFDLMTREFTDRIDIPGDEVRDCCIATDDAIWLPQASGILRRFDVGTLEVTDTLDLGPGLEAGVAAAGAIWIPVYAFSDEEHGATYRIDPLTRAVTDVIPVGSRYTPAFLDEAIWVEGQDTLSRIDVETREVTDVITLSTRKVLEPLASTGVIWAFTEYGGSYRIDGGAAIE
jgi:hypothetical protein